MLFRQYQLPCLSIFSYLIGDETTGRAVVVDPQRDITAYLDDARAHGLTIERVIETHFHADFLSGHLELAEATGAAISYGDEARADFPIDPLAQGQRIDLGDVALEVRHTPGHTPESISVVVWEHADDDEPWAVLTGDALFVGDVGRPDLLTSVGWTADDLARRLYRSLHDQLLTLPDSTRVYPAHGAGSACGKSMSDAVSSTIGEQRATNYALRPMSEDEFVEAVTQGQSVAPLYFAFTADSNRRLHELLDEADPPAPLTVDDVERCLRDEAVVIDGRAPEAFASGHLRGSVNVGLDGRFAEYAGDVLRPGQPVVVVADEGRAAEAKIRLARIGFDRVRGAVVDVERLLAERPDLAERSTRLAAADIAQWRDDEPGLQVVDIRNPGEQEAGVVPGAIRIPLARLLDDHDQLDPAAPTVVYCAGGYRSSIGASLLRSKGFAHVADLQGGYDAWAAAGLPVDKGAVTS
ncbi:MBL fold metallo-hydrolase [Iamia sp. SCSIO 61187]|uniref:MBL fold metallo-hydrolase n=1 Tax=Iamia sp. SCSIO 61187 TaxID=2722752 RepID=UPI001C635327|nr:MBL fold metallo-hydrolase [Iamia sp. SCSIO 61187]QYG93177.1 MBL fold metallo-hydrolase [Iamia sp. SCSIO 61187]